MTELLEKGDLLCMKYIVVFFVEVLGWLFCWPNLPN
jgi:hypothetical protein